MATTQEKLTGITGISGSIQAQVNGAAGYSPHQYTTQAALNIAAGRQPHSLTQQDAINRNLGTSNLSFGDAVEYASTKGHTKQQLIGSSPSYPSGTAGIYTGASTSAIITAADTADLRPETTDAFTWAVWVFFYSLNNNVLPRIIEKSGTYNCVMGDSTNGKYLKIGLEVLDTGNVTTEYWGSTSLQVGRWYHIVTTFDDTTGKHYVNSVAETMSTVLGPYGGTIKSTSSQTFKIGNRNGLARNADAIFKNVRVWNRALNQAEVTQEYSGTSVSSGLVANYSFDEGTGTSITESVNGYTGTASATSWKSINFGYPS